MIDIEPIAAVLAECRRRLVTDGRLPLASRRRLWTALEAGVSPGVAQRRLLLLDTMAVQRMLPAWRAAFPGDNRPEGLLRLAYETLDGRYPADRLMDEADRLQIDLVDNTRWTNETTPALLTGVAAAVTARDAAIGPPNWRSIPPEADDADLDSDAWPSTTLIAWAAAGGMPDRGEFDAAAQRQFWSWYLDEAVPNAVLLAAPAAQAPTT